MSKEFIKLKRKQTIKYFSLVVICTVALLCLVGFLIYATAEKRVPVVAALVFLLITEVIPLLLMILMVHGDSLSSPRRLHFWLFCLPRYHFNAKSTATTQGSSATNSSDSTSGATMTTVRSLEYSLDAQPVEVA